MFLNNNFSKSQDGYYDSVFVMLP